MNLTRDVSYNLQQYSVSLILLRASVTCPLIFFIFLLLFFRGGSPSAAESASITKLSSSLPVVAFSYISFFICSISLLHAATPILCFTFLLFAWFVQRTPSNLLYSYNSDTLFFSSSFFIVHVL